MASPRIDSITAITLNCQGLSQSSKRTVLFYWLNCFKLDIVCLQETPSPLPNLKNGYEPRVIVAIIPRSTVFFLFQALDDPEGWRSYIAPLSLFSLPPLMMKSVCRSSKCLFIPSLFSWSVCMTLIRSVLVSLSLLLFFHNWTSLSPQSSVEISTLWSMPTTIAADVILLLLGHTIGPLASTL